MFARHTLFLSIAGAFTAMALVGGCNCGNNGKLADGGDDGRDDDAGISSHFDGGAKDSGSGPIGTYPDGGPILPHCNSFNDCAYGLVCGPDEVCEPPDVDGGVSAADDGGCQGLECQVVHCPPASPTSISGHVYDPSGQVPLYNAIVYVPNGPVDPFPTGVTCDQCGSVTSGHPLSITLTGPEGAFSLSNVPIGNNIPLVFQIGKWRRQITIPTVPACTNTPVGSADLQHLPRNQAEGDMPQMAISTGSADPFECLLLKMGIDGGEFTSPSGPGRVHMYHSNGSSLIGSVIPDGGELWLDGGNLARYDVVLLPCEGGAYAKVPAGLQNLVNYTNAGGRVFATHYSYSWTALGANPFPSVADWEPDPGQLHNPPAPGGYFWTTIDQNFPKGVAFAQWLQNVGALDAGSLGIADPRNNVRSVNVDGGSTQWLEGAFYANIKYKDGGQTGNLLYHSTQHLTWNMPYNPPPLPDGGDGLQCGRVVFSDFHVSTSALNLYPDAGRTYDFPNDCIQKPLTPQEKALIFMLFDVSSCVQSDRKPPTTCPGAGDACSTDSPCCSELLCLDSQNQSCAPGQSCSCQPQVN